MAAEPKTSGPEARKPEPEIEAELRQLVAELDEEFRAPVSGYANPLRLALKEAIEKAGFHADEPDLVVWHEPGTIVVAYRGIVIARLDLLRLLSRVDAIDIDLQRKAKLTH